MTERSVKTAIAEARIESFPDYYEAVGTVRAEITSTLSGKIMGTITEVNAHEGDRVTKGQVLLNIDNRQVSAHLKQAKAALEEAIRAESAALSARDEVKAGAELAQLTYRRYLKLKEDNAASKQEFDQIEIRLRQAEAALKQAESSIEAAEQRVKQAEAAVASAEVSRKDADISSPFDGVVINKMVDVGDLSAPGTPFLTVEKDGDLEIDAIIPEDRIRQIYTEQDLDIVFPLLQDRYIRGKVKSVVPAADPQSRTFLVKITIPKTEGIHSGMFARVRIPKGLDSMLLIPGSAVVVHGQLSGVFVLDEGMIARFRVIRTGRKAGDSVEVISGLRDGAKYVVSPPPRLNDGDRVEALS
ncbi:MAG: efflux RND transporter periplasmic adaptor subunit [Deltaproteobacteria bacterium]|nr:efflux RND transporter periplasmic adaptor subunit [Deltaproteobacteria bacterium]